MSSAARSAERSLLQLELPAGWRRVHTDNLLDATVRLGEEPEAQALYGPSITNMLEMIADEVRAVQQRTNLIVTALRFRADPIALDVLAIAVPPRPSEGQIAGGSAAGNEAVGDPIPGRLVEHDGFVGVAHVSSATGPEAEDASLFPTSVQLTMAIPDTDRGAIVTMLSSAREQQEDMLEVAMAVGASMCVRAEDGSGSASNGGEPADS